MHEAQCQYQGCPNRWHAQVAVVDHGRMENMRLCRFHETVFRKRGILKDHYTEAAKVKTERVDLPPETAPPASIESVKAVADQVAEAPPPGREAIVALCDLVNPKRGPGRPRKTNPPPVKVEAKPFPEPQPYPESWFVKETPEEKPMRVDNVEPLPPSVNREALAASIKPVEEFIEKTKAQLQAEKPTPNWLLRAALLRKWALESQEPKVISALGIARNEIFLMPEVADYFNAQAAALDPTYRPAQEAAR